MFDLNGVEEQEWGQSLRLEILHAKHCYHTRLIRMTRMMRMSGMVATNKVVFPWFDDHDYDVDEDVNQEKVGQSQFFRPNSVMVIIVVLMMIIVFWWLYDDGDNHMTDNQMMQVMKMRKLVNQRGFDSLKLLPPYLTVQWLQKSWSWWGWLRSVGLINLVCKVGTRWGFGNGSS